MVSSSPSAGSPVRASQARAIVPQDIPQVRSLLLRNLPANLFLLGFLERIDVPDADKTLTMAGLWSDDDATPQAVVLVSRGGLAVPYAPSPWDAVELGRHLRGRQAIGMVVGPREACDALWTGMEVDHRPRLLQDQRLYVAEQVPEGPVCQGQRLATLADANVVERYTSLMMLEDLGFDPAFYDPVVHREQVLRRIRQGNTFVVEHDGTLTFKVDVGTRLPGSGATLGGTYVPPGWRGRGLCQSAMRGVTRALLAQFPRVALHVNEANTSAVRAYEGAGYQRRDPFRIIMAA
jgi:uncharacterized protein